MAEPRSAKGFTNSTTETVTFQQMLFALIVYGNNLVDHLLRQYPEPVDAICPAMDSKIARGTTGSSLSFIKRWG